MIINMTRLVNKLVRNCDSSFVILNKSQTTTHIQMKMFFTRKGKQAQFIIHWYPGHIDLPPRQVSWLKDAILPWKDMKGIAMVQMDEKDVIRHKLVKQIINAYTGIESK